MEYNYDFDGSGLELVHVSDVLDYLGKHCLFFNNKKGFFFKKFLTLKQEDGQERTFYIQQQQHSL